MAQEAKLIDYLSKEIETQTNGLMAFRERIVFALFVGPFVLLGAILYGKGITQIHFDAMNLKVQIVLLGLLVLVIVSYLSMGFACSLLEGHIWQHANQCRKRIAEISRGETAGFTTEQLEFELRKGGNYLTRAYLQLFFAMIVAFAGALALVLIAQKYM